MQNTAVLTSTECNARVETKALRPIEGYFKLLSIFRRVRIIAKSVYYLHHVSASTRTYQRGPNRRTLMKFYVGDF